MLTSKELRDDMLKAFSDGEFDQFCFDNYQGVYNQFTTGMKKSQKIQILLEYVYQNDGQKDLMDHLIKERPLVFAELKRTVTPVSTRKLFKKHTRTIVFVVALLVFVVIMRLFIFQSKPYISIPRDSISWHPGHSKDGEGIVIPEITSSFNNPEEPQPITIKAGLLSHPDFPRLTYPMSGNFEAIVSITVDEAYKSPVYNLSAAGLGIYSAETNERVLLSQAFFDIGGAYHEEDVRGVHETVTSIEPQESGRDIIKTVYEAGVIGNQRNCGEYETVYLKIKKLKDYVYLFCSIDGDDWEMIREEGLPPYSIKFGSQFHVFLFAYSTSHSEITAQYSRFEIREIPWWEAIFSF